MIGNLNEAQKKNRDMGQKIFVSLRWKVQAGFTVIFSIVFFIALISITDLAVQEASKQIQVDLTQALEGIAATIDVDMLIELAETGEINQEGFSDDPRYLELMACLDQAHTIEPDAWPYLYLPSDTENQIIAVVDLWAIYDEDSSFSFLEPYTSNSGFLIKGFSQETYRAVDHPFVSWIRNRAEMLPENFSWLAIRLVKTGDWLSDTNVFSKREFGTYGDQFGRWASGYMPLTNRAGEKVAAIGVDFIADTVLEVQHAARISVRNAFLLAYPIFLIIITIFVAFFTEPLRMLAVKAERIIGGDYDVDFDDVMNQKFNDEVTELSKTLSEMIDRLQRREQQYRSVVAGQRDFIVRWNREYHWTFVNKIYSEALGVTPEALVGSPVSPNLLPGMGSEFRDNLRVKLNLLTPDNAEVSVEIPGEMSSGETRWMQWQISAFFDSSEALIEWQAVGRDISTLKELQAELEKANIRLKQLSQHLMIEKESEYQHLARILHDDVLNYLSRVSLSEIVGQDKSWLDPEVAIEQLRNLIFNLRSPMLEYGLYFAIYEYSERLIDQISEKQKLTFEIDQSTVRFSTEVETHIYRIVMQACENILKHANAASIHITGKISSDQIEIGIEDDGDGFHFDVQLGIEELAAEGRFGLLGMKERAELIGAKLEIQSNPQTGTAIRILWEPNALNE